MKMIKAIMVAVALTASTSAFAQFTNAKSAASATSSDNNGWSTFYFEYSPSKLNYDGDDSDSESFTGLSLGYNRAFSISNSAPLFIETGLGLQYSFFSRDVKSYYSDEEIKFYWLSAKVPVELLYAWQIPNSAVELIPHAGINLRLNILGKEKYDGEDYDLFDKDDMGGSDNTLNRFQIGWQIGVKARFNKRFMIGLSYGSDSEISKKTTTSGLDITAGITF